MTNGKISTDQLHAIIYFGVDSGLSNTDIYKLCYPDDDSKDLPSTASHWQRGKRIAAIYDKVRIEIKARNEKVMEVLNASTNGNLSQNVDFTDKGQFIQYLNNAANRITDDKLKNDILKMLSDHLDFKDESKRDDNNQIQRFYLPLRCQDCKLYQEVAK